MSLEELSAEIRSRFPGISEAADRLYERQFGADSPMHAHSWFESLANAVNLEMSRGIDPMTHGALFAHLERALNSSDVVFRCLDVAFVENLFWQVPAAKADPYWQTLPARFKALYEAFHHRKPVR
ncbi:MAG: hypothetical protein ACJ8IK_06630 [Burkholderiaceae bacterium]